MTGAEKWNLIVDEYQHLYSSLEEKVQSAWEMYCAELFEYKKLLHEIDAQRHLSVGSGGAIIPDIILKINGKDIFDIELKKYSLPFHESFESQLISYLNQTHLSTGMIVCNKIYLYCYEYATISVNKIEIPFEKNNPDGIALMEMLTKDNFSAEKIYNYILEKQQHEKNILEINQQLKNIDWVKEIIKLKLLEQYAESDVEFVLKDLDFKVTSKKNSTDDPQDPEPPNPNPLDILLIIHEWCNKKIKSSDISFGHHKSNKKYTRFTTSDLDKIIPYQDYLKSGFGNGHFYAYEIINYNSEFKMVLTLCNKNAPEAIRHTFRNVRNILNQQEKKSNWEWWYVFSTKSFFYDDDTTAEEVYQALDNQFSQIKANISELLKEM